MERRVPQVLIEGFFAAEVAITGLTLEGCSVRRRVSQVLIEGLFAVKGTIAGYTVGAHFAELGPRANMLFKHEREISNLKIILTAMKGQSNSSSVCRE